MDVRTYEYQSDFARRYVAQGVAQGEVAGRAAVVARLLAVRFGPLTADVERSIREASIPTLDAMVERLLVAETLREAVAGL